MVHAMNIKCLRCQCSSSLSCDVINGIKRARYHFSDGCDGLTWSAFCVHKAAFSATCHLESRIWGILIPIFTTNTRDFSGIRSYLVQRHAQFGEGAQVIKLASGLYPDRMTPSFVAAFYRGLQPSLTPQMLQNIEKSNKRMPYHNYFEILSVVQTHLFLYCNEIPEYQQINWNPCFGKIPGNNPRSSKILGLQ